MGKITEPWETPVFVEKDSDDVPSTTTLILLLERKLSNHLPSVGKKPRAGRLARRFLCQTCSKAFEISSATARVSWSLEFCSRYELYRLRCRHIACYELFCWFLSDGGRIG